MDDVRFDEKVQRVRDAGHRVRSIPPFLSTEEAVDFPASPFAVLINTDGDAYLSLKSGLFAAGNNDSAVSISNLATFTTTPADAKYIGIKYTVATDSYILVDAWTYAPKIAQATSTSLGPDPLGNEQFDVEPVSWVKPVAYFTTDDTIGVPFGDLFLVQLVTTHLQLFAFAFGPEDVDGVEDGSMFRLNYPFPR